jgi:hypothetical protein
MSAFFVSYGTIDDTVDAFREIERGPCDADALGRALLALNAEAMRQRYPQILTERLECGRTEHAAYIDAARAYTYRPGHKDPRQRAKSAACLAYQCTEGDVPETPLRWRRRWRRRIPGAAKKNGFPPRETGSCGCFRTV